jgi:hypothetical protein
MAKKNAENRKEAGKRGVDAYAAVGIAIVAIALFAIGANYFAGAGSGGVAPSPVAGDPLDSKAGRILLKSYDAGAGLSDYWLNYSMDDNGAGTGYVVAKAGNQSEVRVYGNFGVMRGYFQGGNASNDTVCLTYGQAERCARLGGNEVALSIANNLRMLLPDKATYLNQKTDIKKLVNAGAVKLNASVEDAKIGQFETSKISYVVDYRGLTVEKLGSIGVSPNDAAIYSVTEVTYWMDKKTGLMVKSHASIDNRGTKSYFDVEYYGVGLDGVVLAPPPNQVYDVTDFLKFYKKSADDYTSKETCKAKAGAERDSCYKSLAMDELDWEVCKLISNSLEYERCAMYVAHETTNPLLCEQLPTFGDDCYISVVSQNGDAELCKKLKNSSLTAACADAVAEGKKLQDARDDALQKRILGQNCAVDSGCKTAGAYKQYCIPKNTSLDPAMDNSPSIIYGCYAGLACGCNGGYCGFNKTDAYYGCVSAVEDDMLREFINNLVESANGTTKN